LSRARFPCPSFIDSDYPCKTASSRKDFIATLKEIVSVIGDELPISAEVISLKADEMVEQGKRLAVVSPNIVIKLPMTADGLKATKQLTSLGIKTNVTLIFSSTQALLAARAGATYVSPFIGRLDDINQIGMDLVRQVRDIFRIHALQTEIIAASVRHTAHVIEAALAGAHIATIPFKVIEQMTKHPLTDQGIAKFLADWEQANLGNI